MSVISQKKSLKRSAHVTKQKNKNKKKRKIKKEKEENKEKRPQRSTSRDSQKIFKVQKVERNHSEIEAKKKIRF